MRMKTAFITLKQIRNDFGPESKVRVGECKITTAKKAINKTREALLREGFIKNKRKKK